MRKQIGKIKNDSMAKRARRKLKIRKTISGTKDVPRLCPNKTNKHILIQAIDDETGVTLFTCKSFGKNVEASGSKKDKAKVLGAQVASKLKENNIDKVVFDRNGYKYTGVLTTLADSIRENGIKF
ncbi:MAG: 50S ribosomal protein L18 [Bacteriovoracaceae bacterium]